MCLHVNECVCVCLHVSEWVSACAHGGGLMQESLLVLLSMYIVLLCDANALHMHDS